METPATPPTTPPTPTDSTIQYDDFAKVQLRVATVTDCTCWRCGAPESLDGIR